ncbi:MAG TPA: HIRAN domain-containing protein [Nocardioidaceae bacterium]|nr:HIRAN domain-containing protein [Nocardioidaceae bacterium]
MGLLDLFKKRDSPTVSTYLCSEAEARALQPGPDGLIEARLELIRDQLLVVTPLGWINPRSRTAHRAGLYLSNLKGTAYHEAAVKAGRFTPGANVRLVREPNNPHDPNAIAVYAEGGRDRAGYVSAVRAKRLAKLMDAGHDLVGVSVRGADAGVDGTVPRILVCERPSSNTSPVPAWP